MAETRDILFKLTAPTATIRKQLDSVTTLLTQQRNELKQLNRAYKNGEVSTEEYAKQQVDLKQDIAKLGKEQRGYIKDLQNTEKVTDSLEGSNDQLSASIALLQREYNKLSREQRENTQAGKELTRSLADQRQALKDNQKQVNDNRLNVGNYESAFGGLTDAIGGNVAGLVGPGGFVAAGALAVDLIKDGIQEVIEIERRFTSLRGEVQRLTDAVGPELDNLVIRIEAISKTFGKDFNEVLIASNSLAKQLGISVEESTNLIEKGFLAGADQSGELLDVLREYGPFLREAGIEAETAIEILTRSVKEGVFTDKGIGAIKEAQLSLRELTPVTREALAGIGLSSEEIAESLRNGTKSTFDIIKEISAAIDKLPENSVEVGAALADIFKGDGEDAGVQFITTLQNAGDGIESLIDPTNALTQLQIKQLAVEERLADAQQELAKVFQGTGGELDNLIKEGKIFLIEILLGIIEELRELAKSFEPVINVARRVGEVFSGLAERFNNLLERFGFARQEFSLFESAAKLIGKLVTTPLLTIVRVVGSAIDAFSFLFNLIGDGINKIKELSNDLLGTDFEVEVDVETKTSELNIENLQKALDGVAPPLPIPITLNTEDALKEAEELNEALTREAIRAAKERQRKLQILQKEQIEDDIAGIQLRLLEVKKGTEEELTLRKMLLDKQRDLAFVNTEQTKNQELLLIEKTENKKVELENQFQKEKLEISVIGLEKSAEILKAQLDEEIDLELTANAQIKADNLLLNGDLVKSKELYLDELKRVNDERVLNEAFANTQTREFSEQTLTKQRDDLKKLLESTKLTAEQREEIERQLQDTNRQLAATTINFISQLNDTLGNLQEARKERELKQAQGNAQKEEEIEKKFAKKEQQRSIIESIIATALSVVKALPNIPLSIAVGAIGAINTGIIASQSFADGGFTGIDGSPDPQLPGRKITGYVHDNEFVVNDKALKNKKIRKQVNRIDMFQRGKLAGFAGGGFTSPTFSDGGIGIEAANESFNAQEMGNMFRQAVKDIQIVASIKEINDVGNRVKIKENQSAV